MMNSIPGDFIPAEGEELVRCPYNESHVITNLRLGVHLSKCRKEYEKGCKRLGKSMDMKNCRFNDKHVVPGPEITIHEAKCQESQKVIDTIIYHQSAQFQRSLAESEARRQEQEQSQPQPKIVWGKPQNYPEKPPPAPFSAWGEETEDWESDAKSGYEAAYDPSERMRIDGSLYQPRGLSKSERKKYRAEQKALAAQRETTSNDLRDMKESFAKFGLADEKKDTGNIKKEPESWNPGSSSGSGFSSATREDKMKGHKFICDDVKEEDEYVGDDPFA